MEEPEPMETAEKETGAAGYPGAGAGSPEVDGAPAGQDKDLVASRVSNNETQFLKKCENVNHILFW